MKRFILTIFVIAAAACCKHANGGNDDNGIITKLDPDTDLYGVVTDADGNFMQGVVVSDGYSCTQTDGNGVYQLIRNEHAYQVYVSIPAKYEIPVENGLPCFWRQLSAEERYDFRLKALPGGAERDFRLFCIADPQCQSTAHVDRFASETIPDIAREVAESDVPCYGITLGDVIWNTASKDNSTLLARMKVTMSQSNTGMPVFQIMGNHDNAVISGTYSAAHDIAAQRNFEYSMGPVNYSFDRGSVHIVAMDNVIFTDHDNYSCGFRDDQVEWLRQDLGYVSKDKPVILCVHIPLRNSKSYKNVQTVLEMLAGYAGVHVMAGHTHYAQNNIFANKNDMYEHVHGAACGAWWYSTINVDGTPNGYGIYEVSDAGIVGWKYKPTQMDENFQIRLYRGNEVFPGDFMFEYKAADQIVANIWNADKNWKIDVYENGGKTGSMSSFATSVKRDAWAVGYHRAVVKRTGSSYDFTSNSHLYYYTLKDAGAEVEVRATDPHGNVFTQTKFTGGTSVDYPSGY